MLTPIAMPAWHYDKNRNGIVDRAETIAPTAPISVPASAFQATGGSDVWFGDRWVGGQGADWCVEAPLYLPDGATIARFTAFIEDRSTYRSIHAQLVGTIKSTGNATGIASVESSGASSSIQMPTDTTIRLGEEVVDNENRFYSVTACGGDAVSLYLYGAEVAFETG